MNRFKGDLMNDIDKLLNVIERQNCIIDTLIKTDTKLIYAIEKLNKKVDNINNNHDYFKRCEHSYGYKCLNDECAYYNDNCPVIEFNNVNKCIYYK